jgi:hypothetical protein
MARESQAYVASLVFLRRVMPRAVLVHVVGVRIEPAEHSLQCILDEQLRPNRMNVVAFDDLDDPHNELKIGGH